MTTISTLTVANTPIASKVRRRESAWLWVMIASWLTAIGVGWLTLAKYEFRWLRADSPAAIARWPSDTSLMLAAGRPTVLFFMHPKCPCTRATLNQLSRLWLLGQHDSARAPQLTVVVTVPFGASDDWYETVTVEQASALRGANLAIDRNGLEARRFGVATSGTVMWFDADGRRLYSGGITPSRGHEGDSAGGDAMAGLLRGNRDAAFGLPAFGCRLCLPAPADAAAKRTDVNTSSENKRGDLP